MNHGIDLEVLAAIAAGAVLWGLVSSRLERWNITAPIAFVVFGLIAANEPLSLIDIHANSAAVRTIAEITLALVLFSDASRVNLGRLRDDAAVPTRLLLIGLPLTIGLGCLAALVVFGGMDPWVAAVIGAAVAPTDAALGAPIMEDHRIPRRVRRILNVESGLNDGIATPVVMFFIAGAASEAHVAGAHGPGAALLDLLIGAAVGAVVALAGGWLLRRAEAAGWSEAGFRPVAVLGLALLAYAAAVEAGGNGFVAAFLGGLAFGWIMRTDASEALELTADGGTVGSIVIWFLFGALLVPTLDHIGWDTVLYAAVSLTVVRMVPVALALVGTGLDRATVGIVGWFGPRGLASVVFALIAFDSMDPADAQTVLGVVTMVVLLSVVAHGASARPLAGWYAGRTASLDADRPEHGETGELRTRRFARPRHQGTADATT